jgi:hypothetical protein
LALTTKAQFLAAMAGAQIVYLDKTSVSAASPVWNTTIHATGGASTIPNGAGVLAGTSTTQGVVPVAGQPGFPAIRGFGSGLTGYLAQADFTGGNTIGGRFRVLDLLFKAGPYNFNDSGITLSSQPSYLGRVPGGGAGTGSGNTEMYFEAVTAFTGNPTITVTYTNQDGVTGCTTTYVATFAPSIGRATQMPLANGDTGVRKIESVSCSVATVGTFNIIVCRPLFQGRFFAIGDTFDMYRTLMGPDKLGLPQVYDTSALFFMYNPEGGTNSGNCYIALSIIEA